ncbi:unnamed protein product [Ilex paraguariensis]|uniref:DnaJ/Hsp40 cysteine-rich domain superfamily protein n=1 Tax=Ilex paraguariensis TaxID=185542 RepID=A0ABC8TFB6_9AQUA
MFVTATYWRQAVSNVVGDVHKRRSSFESLFCYDKAIPEEMIEKPIGLSLAEKDIGDNPHCDCCQAKGAVLCATCSGSGLYVDSILESQGIIVKVRCLGIDFIHALSSFSFVSLTWILITYPIEIHPILALINVLQVLHK